MFSRLIEKNVGAFYFAYEVKNNRILLAYVCLSNVVVVSRSNTSQSSSSRDSPLLPCPNLPLNLTPLHLKLQGCVMAVRSTKVSQYSQMRCSSCCLGDCDWSVVGRESDLVRCLVPGTIRYRPCLV